MGTLRRLLDAGTPVDSRDARRRTPLLAATPPRSLEHLAMITLVLRTVVLRVRFATAGNTAVLALAGRTRACVNALRWP
jgi:hypothetical protein